MSRALLSLLLMWAVPAVAAVVGDLYQARVPVAEQSPAELRRAARGGLAEVLVRVSGRTDAARHPELAGALGNAERYVEQYRYDSEPSAPEPGADAQAPAESQSVLLRFAPSQIEGMLRQAGLPVWGANRPTLLVWLAYDDGTSRALVNEESQPALVQALREQARRRGLLLSFPLLDLDDMAAVTADLVWQMDLLKLQDASTRYRADGLMVGRVAALPGGRWLGSWRLVAGEQRVSVDGEGASLTAYLLPGIDRIADTLSALYASANDGSAPGTVRLQLSGVGSFADYSRVLAYLGRLSQVKSVMPVEVAEGEMTLQLEINGGVAQLQRALALENRLQPAAADPALPVSSGLLRYRWLSRS
jgi:hypothetical protein